MAPTLALRFLSFVLFFLMNGHGSSARDMKVELRDHKQVDSYGATLVSRDKPYVAGYRTTSDSTQPYIAGYRTTTDSAQESQESTHDTTEPYITSYGEIGSKKVSKKSVQDSSKPYITQYGNLDPKQDPKESTQDYAATYKKKSENAYAAKRGTMQSFINRKTGQDLEESKVGPPSSNVDHTEAFKTGFFTLDDLYVGNIMTLQFPVQEFSHFLARKEADSIPFSTSQLASVLQLFSISEDSPQAKSMKGTIEQCEAEPITGETKVCVSSLESMLEFVGAIIGSEANYNILTTSYPTTSSVHLQNYTILEVSQDINAPKWVACHPLPYPYAVYYCHFIATGSKVFKVFLDGENGDKMEALGVCHFDTSDWSPDHILFKQLGIKPGEAPVCHFFPVKHLLWAPRPSKATT